MDLNSFTRDKKHNASSIRICDLPDHILQLIISSLSTKEAIQTSRLSKRWLHLRKGISKVEFKERRHKKRQKFMDFVRRLLVVCDCSNLEKFSLSCEVAWDASQVNEWLRGFINPKIQELSLHLESIWETLVFPDHLFTCATLTGLRLNMQHIFKLPSSIHFGSLRTLTLGSVIFPDSSSTQQLFSGCPSLEELSLLDCNWANVKAVSISSPLLQKIIIRDLEQDYYDDDMLDEYDDIGGQNVSNCCEVAINGTNLKLFSYDGVLKNDFFLHSTTSAINASVEVYPPPYSSGPYEDWGKDAGYVVFKLLNQLSSVEILSISDLAISIATPLQGHLPVFSNLAELCVVSTIELSCKTFLAILRNSPCLHVINFEGGVVCVLRYFANCVLDPLPMCFRTHLKRINIRDFCGSERELHAIKISLQAASVLSTLRIHFDPYHFHMPFKLETSKKFCEPITSFPKGSVDCVIEFR